ncbi:MAG: aminotransferase [Bacteroidetes bacterium]|nr:aminotransferase [Bacteroidota bacterium]
MKKFEGNFVSQLPGDAISIFAVMSKISAEHGALNMSQGFPDFEVSPKLIDRIHYYMKQGHNQYAPMTGVQALNKQISNVVKELHGADYDPQKEINITSGATQAIYTIISAVIKDDDEAIIFEPAYDSYAPSIKLNGGIVKHAQLRMPDYSIDWEEFARMITHRTKLVIINTPHNPTGSIISAEDMQRLGEILRGTDILVLSDEVYEHLIYDDNIHQSVAKFPELAQRSFVVGSFGKTFHATGWKMGFVLAPENLMAEFRKAHQWVVFTVNTPIQYALADYLSEPKNYLTLGSFYQKKRDYFLRKIKKSRFKIVPSSGTYFQVLDYSDISDEGGMDFAVRMIKEFGMASIPLSPFYQDKTETHRLRFCFAKEKETLDKAGEILCQI